MQYKYLQLYHAHRQFITPVKVPEHVEKEGIDAALHSETVDDWSVKSTETPLKPTAVVGFYLYARHGR